MEESSIDNNVNNNININRETGEVTKDIAKNLNNISENSKTIPNGDLTSTLVSWFQEINPPLCRLKKGKCI